MANILIVEDEPRMRRLLEISLSEDGHSVHTSADAETALLHLRKALELKSAGPTAHYYLGLTFISTKRYDEAQKEFEAAISNGGENLAVAHKYLGGLYMRDSLKKQEAADELEKYVTLDPKEADAERIKATIKDLRNKQ